MQIRSKLLFTVFIPFFVALVIGITMIFSYQDSKIAQETGDKVRLIRNRINEINDLVFSYIVDHQERPKQQFMAVHKELATLLNGLELKDLDQQQLLDEIRLNNRFIKETFLRLVSNNEQIGKKDTDQFLNYVEKRLAGQLMIRVRSTDSLASTLRSLVDADVKKNQEKTFPFIFLVTCLAGIPITMITAQIRNRINTDLTQLSQGTEVISSGNLDYVIPEGAKDEIGGLTRAFNRMTLNLKKVTASKAELEKEIRERQEAETALKDSEEKYRTLFAVSLDALFLVDRETKAILEVNEAACRLYGYTAEEMLRLKSIELSADPVETDRAMRDYQDGPYTRWRKKKDGTLFPVDITAKSFYLKGRQLILASVRDTSQRRMAETYRNLSADVLKILNEGSDIQKSIRRIGTFVKEATGCDAVGIRLQEGEDFPYLYQQGFSEDFLLNENSLVDRAQDWPCREPDRSIPLKGNCGLVLSGKSDPADPLLSPGGSWWSNNIRSGPEFSTGPEEKPIPRNQCLHQGYVSMALVPIRERDKVIGILQLNDCRKERFNLEAIGSLESITSHIGEALLRKKAEQGLRERTQQLEELTTSLEKKVKERTSDLEKANDDLRQLSKRLLTVQEDERKKIARELHDGLASNLAGIKFKIEYELNKAKTMPGIDRKAIEALIPLIQEGVEECRRIQMDLRPPMLDSLGLLKTLSWFFRTVEATYPALSVEQEIEIEETDIPAGLKTVIFRVVQEAINNVSKYSQAEHVVFSFHQANGSLILVIRDYGQGFDLEKRGSSDDVYPGFGLTSMRERVHLSGGTFAIESKVGEGTMLRAIWAI
jgi:PAS domain S-box-containing protein